MKKNLTKNILRSLAIVFAPLVAFAQTGGSLCGPITYTKSLQWYLCEVYTLVGRYLIPLLNLAALSWFMWGIITFIRNANNEEQRKVGKQHMIWGLIALFVMVSVWGIIGILGGIVGTNTSVIPQIRYK